MSDASDEVVVATTSSKRREAVGVNDAITRALLLKWAIISICGVAKGWDSVVGYKEEMSFNYVLLRYFGFFLMYVYIFRLACCFFPSDHPPNYTTFKGRPILLTIISLMVSVTMFNICYTWKSWDVFCLTLGVLIAAISLAQLIYGVDGQGAFCVLGIAIFGSVWGINGLYFDITSGLVITCTFCIFYCHIGITLGIYDDDMKVAEEELVGTIKEDMEKWSS